MNQTIIDTRIDRGDGGQLHVHFRPVSTAAAPTVVFSHGFTVDGTESHRMFLRMARRYNQAGFTTINFDYYGIGYSDGEYSEFSVSTGVSDLNAVLEWARKRPEIDANCLLLHGQSLGTAIATIVTTHRSDIRGCILWNLSADLERRYSVMLGNEIFDKGYAWIPAKGYLIDQKFMEDVRQYDVLSYFDNWSTPTLFISSGSDTRGEPGLAEKANDKIGEYGTRVVIDGANHSFKCQPELEEQATVASLEWVNKLKQREGA